MSRLCVVACIVYTRESGHFLNRRHSLLLNIWCHCTDSVCVCTVIHMGNKSLYYPYLVYADLYTYMHLANLCYSV